MNCPFCGRPAEADFVDIGVGMERCGPWHCDFCVAVQTASKAEFDGAIKQGATPEPSYKSVGPDSIIFAGWVRYENY